MSEGILIAIALGAAVAILIGLSLYDPQRAARRRALRQAAKVARDPSRAEPLGRYDFRKER